MQDVNEQVRKLDEQVAGLEDSSAPLCQRLELLAHSVRTWNNPDAFAPRPRLGNVQWRPERRDPSLLLNSQAPAFRAASMNSKLVVEHAA